MTAAIWRLAAVVALLAALVWAVWCAGEEED